jgi:hypothetical protein
MITLLVLLTLQSDGWTAAPLQPTVGDTIRLERAITAPAGWRLRAGKLASTDVAEPLGDAMVLAGAPGEWLVRYTVVAWMPGAVTIPMPQITRLGPDGTADSLPGGSASFHVASVIPDSVKSPLPQPAVGPLRLARASPIPVLVAVILSAGALLLLIAWRRRGPRVIAAGPAAIEGAAETPDARWLSAGEPKAVAARATQRLRRAVANAIPDAHEALSTSEFLEAVERAWPNAPLRDLREMLQALDQVTFATAHGVEVGPLAARARALAREFRGNGAATSHRS